MYLYLFLACILATANACANFTATEFNFAQVCFPLYEVSDSNSVNTTGTNLISGYLSSLKPLPPRSCINAFTQYYCSYFYPECDGTSDKRMCRTTCQEVVEECDSYRDMFIAHPILVVPAVSACTSLSVDPNVCSPASNISTSAYYTECEPLDPNGFSPLYNLICQPKYKVPVGNISYEGGNLLFQTYALFSNEYTLGEDPEFPEYPCLKAMAEFYCANYYPECPSGGALPVRPVCHSVCVKAKNYCAGFAQFFIGGPLYPPDDTMCNFFFPPSTTNCFVPQNNSYLGYFFGSDPPVAIEPTEPPESSDWQTIDDDWKYPPGGAMKGGAIGGGIIAGILLFIGVLTLIMKKQDTR